MEQAKIRFDILRELAPDSEDFKQAEEYFRIVKMKTDFAKTLAFKEEAIKVKVNKTALTDIKTPPEFTHKEISFLYENGKKYKNCCMRKE
ncbi:MAG TPA: hypothetical protein ENG85_02840 [Bacteroidetes bacterium]|nr:hypothetical protein [Bacteroidota bacterium]